MDYVSEAYSRLCEALLKWLNTVAEANSKYYDITLIHNLGYFVESMGQRGIPAINRYVSLSMLQRTEAEARYVSWMVSYECPGLCGLTDRINNVVGRVSAEELALYVPR